MVVMTKVNISNELVRSLGMEKVKKLKNAQLRFSYARVVYVMKMMFELMSVFLNEQPNFCLKL